MQVVDEDEEGVGESVGRGSRLTGDAQGLRCHAESAVSRCTHRQREVGFESEEIVREVVGGGEGLICQIQRLNGHGGRRVCFGIRHGGLEGHETGCDGCGRLQRNEGVGLGQIGRREGL
jgi:hypothetical protein